MSEKQKSDELKESMREYLENNNDEKNNNDLLLEQKTIIENNINNINKNLSTKFSSDSKNIEIYETNLPYINVNKENSEIIKKKFVDFFLDDNNNKIKYNLTKINLIKKIIDKKEEEEKRKKEEEEKRKKEEEEKRKKEEEEKRIKEEEEKRIKEEEEKRIKEEEEKRKKEEEEKRIKEEEENRKKEEEEKKEEKQSIKEEEEEKSITEEEKQSIKEDEKKEKEKKRKKDEEKKRIRENEVKDKRGSNNLKKNDDKRGTNKIKKNNNTIISIEQINEIKNKNFNNNNIKKKMKENNNNDNKSSQFKPEKDNDSKELKRNLNKIINKENKDEFEKYFEDLKNEKIFKNKENYDFNNLKKKHSEILNILRKNIKKLKLYKKANDLNKAKNDLYKKINDLKREHNISYNGKSEFFEIYYDLKRKKEEKDLKVKVIEKIIDKKGVFNSNELKLRNKMLFGFLCMILYLYFFNDK